MMEGDFQFNKTHLDILRSYEDPIDKLVYLAKHYGSSVQKYRTELLWNLWKTYATPELQCGDGLIATPIDSLIHDQMSGLRNELYKLLRIHYYAETAEQLYVELVEVTTNDCAWETEREITKDQIKVLAEIAMPQPE